MPVTNICGILLRAQVGLLSGQLTGQLANVDSAQRMKGWSGGVTPGFKEMTYAVTKSYKCDRGISGFPDCLNWIAWSRRLGISLAWIDSDRQCGGAMMFKFKVAGRCTASAPNENEKRSLPRFCWCYLLVVGCLEMPQSRLTVA